MAPKIWEALATRTNPRRKCAGEDLFFHGVGGALVLLSHGRMVDPPAPGRKLVVLVKAGVASDAGKISHGGNARLGTDRRGRQHWRSDKREQSARRHPAAAQSGAGLAGAQKSFSAIGIEVTEETASKSGQRYMGFAGNTYAQLAQFRRLKSDGLVWGFRKEGKFLWACKPENLHKVTEAFHGSATGQVQPTDQPADAGSGPSGSRPDRGGDDRGGTRPEPGAGEGVPAGQGDGGTRRARDDRGASKGGDRAGEEAKAKPSERRPSRVNRRKAKPMAKAGAWRRVRAWLGFASPPSEPVMDADPEPLEPKLPGRVVVLVSNPMKEHRV